MTARTWNGSTGAYSTPGDWSPAGVPAAGDTAIIDSGSVLVGAADLAASLYLYLGLTAGATPTLILQNTAIPSTDRLYLGSAETASSPPVATTSVSAAGTVTNAGSIVLSNATLSISGTFINSGIVDIAANASVGLVGSGSFVNDGDINTRRPDSGATTQVLSMPITGTGTIGVYDGTNLEFAGSVGEGQTTYFGRMAAVKSAQSDTQITIDDLTTFYASFGNYDFGYALQPIVAYGPAYDVITSYRINGSTTLAFMHDGQPVSTLRFSSRMNLSQFGISSVATADGRERTTVTYNVAGTAPDPGLSLYRYFDKVNGTQFLTASDSENAAIKATRPDLTFEGLGFKAVNPADGDPTATAICRFFDTATGTHFLTASAAERDVLVASRPDLVYEPNSTFYEHAVAQTGDQAVYRYFESTNGTHFYTASAGERASIMANRPDLIAEGIAFYATTR